MAEVNPGPTNFEAWWDGAGVEDSKGSNTLTNDGVAFVPGIVGNSFEFVRANTDKMYVTDNASISFVNEDFSLVAIGKPAADGLDHTIMGKWAANTSDREYRLDIGSDNKVNFFVSHNGVASQLLESSVTVSADSINIITAVHDSVGNKMHLYVNEGHTEVAYSLGCNDNNATFALGAYWFTGWTSHWDGLIDSVGITREALSADNHEWFYNSGAGRNYNDLIAVPTYRPQVIMVS